MTMLLQFIKKLARPERCNPAYDPAAPKKEQATDQKIIDASENLNRAVTLLRDIAVDTKIQSDILHEQITGQPPPQRGS